MTPQDIYLAAAQLAEATREDIYRAIEIAAANDDQEAVKILRELI